VLTAAERRGALTVVLLLALGTCWDLVQARRPLSGPADPTHAEPPVDSSGGPSPQGLSAGPERAASGLRKQPPVHPVDLNRAAASDLARLPGIGPVLAERIVAARRERGAFAHPEELLVVRGIGPRLFQRLRPYLTVRSLQDSAAAGAHAFRTAGTPDSVQILLQSGHPAFR
jgi:competence ComEA-like helix-hairpin-helix protein